MKKYRKISILATLLAIIFVAYLIIVSLNPSIEGKEVKTSLNDSYKSNNTIELTYKKNNGKEESNDKITIKEAVICLQIKGKKPLGILSRVPSGVNQVYCWMRMANGKGKKIRYLWYFNDKITASNWQIITSNHFRSWCPYTLSHKSYGKGRVDIVTSNGKILKRVRFEVKNPVKSHVRLKRS